ncbi:MAG TPA: hypothetical protein EYP43_01395 [Thermoplasmata archaeon]|nr:hypothetical protein [Thermoplasmata archaeon]
MARKRSGTEAEAPSHHYEVILGLPTLKKVSPRAEAVLESTEDVPIEGRGEADGGREADVMTGGRVTPKNIESLIEAIHELERFRTNAEAELRSLRDKTDRMLTTIGSMDDVRRAVYALEMRMQEVATLFDVLSLDINPFVDYSGSGKPKRDEPFVSEIWILKWLEFLQERMSGYEISNLLEYYKEIGWIDDMIESKAMTYLKSLKFDHLPLDKAVTPTGDVLPLDREETDGWKLRPEDTINSYLFIQRIKGIRVDPDILEEISDEMQRLLTAVPKDLMSEGALPAVGGEMAEAGGFGGDDAFVDTPFEEGIPPSREGTTKRNVFMEVPVIDEEELDRLKAKLEDLSDGEG